MSVYLTTRCNIPQDTWYCWDSEIKEATMGWSVTRETSYAHRALVGKSLGDRLLGIQRIWEDNKGEIWDLRFSWRWSCRCWSFALWHRVHLHATPFRRNILHPSSGLKIVKLINKFAFYGTRRSSVVITKAHPLPLSTARWIQSTSYLSNIHFNIIFSPTPRCFEWSLPFRLSDQNSARFSHLPEAHYMLCPVHPPFHFWWVQIMKILINHIFPSFLSLHLSWVQIFDAIFSNTLNLSSYLNVRDQVSHPYKHVKLVLFNIYIFLYRREDKIFLTAW
jgi:hypothetical protein